MCVSVPAGAFVCARVCVRLFCVFCACVFCARAGAFVCVRVCLRVFCVFRALPPLRWRVRVCVCRNCLRVRVQEDQSSHWSHTAFSLFVMVITFITKAGGVPERIAFHCISEFREHSAFTVEFWRQKVWSFTPTILVKILTSLL
jgi:hypothetical protein